MSTLEFELELAKGNYKIALARCRKLEAAAAEAAARPEIRGQSAMQMVIAITRIARSCPDAGFQEVYDLWAEHAEQERVAYESAVANLQAFCADTNAEILERAAAAAKKKAAAPPRSWAAVARS